MRLLSSTTLLILMSIAMPGRAQGEPEKGQPKPIETTVCKIMENPSSFNNKVVKVRGHVQTSFEYSILEDDDCSNGLWFALADNSGPPGLVATVNGKGIPGGKDAKGATVKPIPVKLIRDANFEKFSHYMAVKAEGKPCINILSEPTPADCAVDRVVATFIGRIDSVSKSLHQAHLKRKFGDETDWTGFGHMGMFDAQIVVGSIENVVALDSLSRAKPGTAF